MSDNKTLDAKRDQVATEQDLDAALLNADPAMKEILLKTRESFAGITEEQWDEIGDTSSDGHIDRLIHEQALK